jgi:tetratricopeptide (TPR) repeat protein
MKSTIQLALDQGTDAHKAGNYQEAERLYRTILVSDPTHADANHNLGHIAASANDLESALSFFKTALEADPTIELFYFSYIDALINNKQFKIAKQVIKKAKKAGFAGKRLKPKEVQLKRSAQGLAKRPSDGPSEADINSLIASYQSGRYGEAEKLARYITQQFPKHQFAWKILGAVFSQTCRMSEALVANQKAVELDTKDSEAYNNLGATLRELGKLDESIESCQRAITLKPDQAEFHDNLGATLRERGKLDESIASCRRAIELKPEYAGTYSNLAVTLRELGRQDEAAASYRQAIALDPGYIEARYNLGRILHEGCDFKTAAEQFTLIDFDMSKSLLLNCLYMQDQRSNFYNQLDLMVKQGGNNAMLGSLISRSNIRYGNDKNNPFCNEPLKYVLETNLLEQCDFRTIFIKGAAGILGDPEVRHRIQNLLTGGFQTAGNIFTQLSSGTDVIQNIIHSELKKYRARFKDSKEGLITNWPTDYSLNGWLVNMKNGGKLASHIHDRGWISGSIYINVPPKLNNDSGNLVVALDNAGNRLGGHGNSQSIDVVTGSLCLFPSSLHHHTIPFQSKEERIVLAFDVVPNN